MMTRVELLYWLGSLGLDLEIVQPMLNGIGSDEQGKRIQKRKKEKRQKKGPRSVLGKLTKNLAGFNFFSASIKNIKNGVSSP